MSDVEPAVAALEAYGFTLVKDRYVQVGRRSQEWQVEDDHFLRYEADGTQMPFRANPDHPQQEGLDRLNPRHAPGFIWEWPPEEIEKVYVHALEARREGSAEAE